MTRANGILEDIAADIGFTATVRLCGAYGGQRLYIPGSVAPGHQIEKLIGASAYRALVGEYGCQTMMVPMLEELEHWRRVRQVANLMTKGMPVPEVARVLMITERQARNLRAAAERIGLLEAVLRHAPRPRGDRQPDLLANPGALGEGGGAPGNAKGMRGRRGPAAR